MLPILVIDNCEDDLFFTRRTFRKCRILNPLICVNLLEDLLKSFAAEDKAPVLILVDMMLQPHSGLEILKVAAQRGLTGKRPFIMISGSEDMTRFDQGYKFGAQSFLVKPIESELLLKHLGSLRGLAVNSGLEGYVLTPAGPNRSLSPSSNFA